MHSVSQSTREFIRPHEARDVFGISRSLLYHWISEGKVKSHVVRAKGNVRGMRLVSVDSVKAYIESQPSE